MKFLQIFWAPTSVGIIPVDSKSNISRELSRAMLIGSDPYKELLVNEST
jgi:hypothetical protein